MLETEMKHFLKYCKISEFTEKSIEALIHFHWGRAMLTY
jgi:hypothetical protein